MRVLIIESEVALAATIRRSLRENRFKVDVALDGRSGLARAFVRPYSAIVVDQALPDLGGEEICRTLREDGAHSPVLMLTGVGAESAPSPSAEGTGADDFLPRPFDASDLLTRLRLLLRRNRIHKEPIIRISDLTIDTDSHEVTRAGRTVALTGREYTLLEALAAQEGRVLDREAIQERVWLDEDSYSNTVDVHIGVLRKKIDQGHAEKLIHTVRGLGYVLRRGGVGMDGVEHTQLAHH
ncbi:DNA-binding response regulator [Capsulimonas corticalis]|uniref:DNA-binding response regulator n=1 Tax=Capsulimonas corticalis TaxID=2219043 RepID=A0A402CYZ1_9BACT|nr:response regulator transcription factor [Capsulimonas corticalis]BDI29623.1 DNA-binding response regulator [Capsulimonas corticalis]